MQKDVCMRHLNLKAKDKWFRLLVTTYRVRKSLIGGLMKIDVTSNNYEIYNRERKPSNIKSGIQFDIQRMRILSRCCQQSVMTEVVKNGYYFKI